MDIQLDYNITTDEFLEMVNSVGWKTYCCEQIELTPTAGNEPFYQKAQSSPAIPSSASA